IRKAPRRNHEPKASALASQARFARNHDAANTKATTAITHHDGGRHARTPVHRPSENTEAAQNNGCRGGLWSRIIRYLNRTWSFLPWRKRFLRSPTKGGARLPHAAIRGGFGKGTTSVVPLSRRKIVRALAPEV